MGIWLLLSMVLAVVGLCNRRLPGPIHAFAGLLYMIPPLALFAFLHPIGRRSDVMALTALTGWTMLILIRNTVSALDGMAAEVKAATDGIGYRRLRPFVEIEPPLALPVMTGIRIATRTESGLMRVTTLIGRVRHGSHILTGRRLMTLYLSMILVGTSLSVALAVLAVGRALTP